VERLVDEGRLAEARARLGELVGARALLIEAMILLREGRSQESLDRAMECLRAAPGNAHANKIVGLNLIALGRKQEAERYLREAVRLAPKDFMAHYYLGMYLLNVRFTEAAEGAFLESLRWNAKYPDAETMLGLTYEQMGRDEAALRHYRRGVELTRESGAGKESAYLYLARFLYARQEFEEARKLLEEAVRVGPASLEAWQLLGRACTASGDGEAAVGALKRAMALDPGEKRTYLFLMQAWQKMGREEDARRARKQYEQLIALELSEQERRVLRPAAPVRP
jgi:tetratricopeptide (TPR) repeat protein